MSTKKIVFERQVHTVDRETGEVLESSSSNVYRLPAEPAYVKMYLDDLCIFVSAPDALKSMLLMLLRRVDYDGYIPLTPRVRKEIAAHLGIADQTFRNRLNDLCKKDLIRRISTNEYQANPHFFARGDWKTICAQRKAFQLRITYSNAGRIIETEAVAEQGNLELES